jgi:YggT family protein
LLGIYIMILFLRALISWFPIDRSSGIVRILLLLTEPVVEPIRAILPPMGMLDLSPMVAMLIILALRQVLTILR